MVTHKQIQLLALHYWDSYCEVFPKLVRFDCPEIKISNRLTRTAGRCHSDDNYIVLGGKFLAQFERNMLNVILPHELAHQIDFNLFGWYERKPHHGAEWCDIMIRIGQQPNAYHSMELKK